MGAPIVLLTDFTLHNWYVGVIKGVISSINPSASVIDLCHNISRQDVREGSFILGNSFGYFPAGSIFVAVVDPGVGGERRNIVVKTSNYFFVAPDNGILSCVFEKTEVEKVYEIQAGPYTLSAKGSTFFGRDIFAPIAAHLSRGVPPEEMGSELESVCVIPAIRPFINEHGSLSGRAVYVDSFGNIITNIDETYLRSVFPGDLPREDLIIEISGYMIRGIHKYYEQVEQGKLVALINSWGYLEIAVNRGNAMAFLGVADKKSLEIFISMGSRS